MNVFVCFDGDHIGRQVGRAVLTDDVSEVRRVDQAIQHGNEIWKSFALRGGGSVIEIGGDEGRIEIAVSHLPELPDIVRQYEEAVGATVSVGIGMRLSESAKALMVAKLRGGRQTLLWSSDMDQELTAAQEKPEGEKIAEEYLNKAVPATGGNRGAHAGFGGHTIPTAPGVDKPSHQQRDHEEAKAVEGMIQDANDAAPPPPEQTHAAQDFEDELHQHAQSQEKSDQQSEVQTDKRLDDLKGQVAQVLMTVRQQMPVLAQMRQTAPEAFVSVMNLVQAVITLGREITSQGQPAMPDTDPQHVHPGLGKAEGKKGTYFEGEKCLYETAAECPDIDCTHRDEDCPACGKKPGESADCKECQKTAAEWQADPKTKVGQLDKSGGPIPGSPNHHHLNLPAGSQVNGKIKVQHQDGSESWVEMRSGAVQGQEADAPLFGMNSHPVSSREPGAR